MGYNTGICVPVTGPKGKSETFEKSPWFLLQNPSAISKAPAEGSRGLWFSFLGVVGVVRGGAGEQARQLDGIL